MQPWLLGWQSVDHNDLQEETTMQKNTRLMLSTLLGVGILGLASSSTLLAQDTNGNSNAGQSSAGQNGSTTDQNNTTTNQNNTNANQNGSTTNQNNTGQNGSTANPSSANPNNNSSNMNSSNANNMNMSNPGESAWSEYYAYMSIDPTDPAWYNDPMPVNYPFAAPGNLDMYHFRSYRGATLEPDSAASVRNDIRNIQSQMLYHTGPNGSTEADMDMIYPMPVNYPFAAPGNTDMYHFRSYRRGTLEPDSAASVRADQQMRISRRQYQEMNAYGTSQEETNWYDPMPVNYPFAAPGNLDMYHFRSYRGATLEPDSAASARTEHQIRQEKRARRQMQPGNSGTTGTGNMNNPGSTGTNNGNSGTTNTNTGGSTGNTDNGGSSGSGGGQ
jgi:hypothetical protein